MMMAYGKIFESLYTGSMVGSGLNVFALWSYVIAAAKPPGEIELNPKLLAFTFGCTVKEVEDAITKLCQPDPDSRSKEYDGRRLLPQGQFLYFVPTWAKYNSIRNEIERREQNRIAAIRYRARKRGAVMADDADAMTNHQESAESAHGDVDVHADVEVPPSPSVSTPQGGKTSKRVRAQAERPDDIPEPLWRDWSVQRNKLRAPITDTVIEGFRREAAKAGISLEAAVREAIERNWRGFRADWWLRDHPKAAGESPGEDFELFWAVYDHKVDRDAAIAAWRRLDPSPGLAEVIATAAIEYAKTHLDRSKRLLPSNWLERRRWTDEPVSTNGVHS